jgi:hypothetical protein
MARPPLRRIIPLAKVSNKRVWRSITSVRSGGGGGGAFSLVGGGGGGASPGGGGAPPSGEGGGCGRTS